MVREEDSDETIIQELPQIAHLSRLQEKENERFRLHLKGNLPLSNPALDTVVQETTDRVWTHIDCTDCGNCCRTLQIVVDKKDAKRLAIRFGMTPQAFAEKYVTFAEDGLGYFTNSPPCPFLAEDNKCVVYEDRPKACRDFPYLYEPHFRSRSLTMCENTAVCPIVFNVWESLKGEFLPSPERKKTKRKKGVATDETDEG